MDAWSQLDSAIRSGWGDWASAVGLIATLIGFCLTLIGVWRSKSAAEKAQEAVTDIRRDIRRIDMVSELSAAISAMGEIKALQRKGAWEILPDRYAALRKALITVHSANVTTLSEDQQTRLQEAKTWSSKMENNLEPYIHDSEPAPDDVTRWNSVVSRHMDGLQEILVKIRTDL